MKNRGKIKAHAKWPYHLSPRCGAKTRQCSSCKSPAVKGKKRCRMHGGAKGSGAPKGSQNALKDGFFTKEAIVARKRMLAAFDYYDELFDMLDL